MIDARRRRSAVSQFVMVIIWYLLSR